MKCYKHNSQDAVGQCVDCNKGLCSECVSQFSPPLCRDCLLQRTATMKSQLFTSSILSVVLFIVGFTFVMMDGRDGFFMAVVNGYIWGAIPWGWRALTKITPAIFLILPIIGWVIYLFIKLLLSAFVGMFVAPFKIFQLVSNYKKAQALEASA